MNDLNTLLSRLQAAIDNIEEGLNTGDSRNFVQRSVKQANDLLERIRSVTGQKVSIAWSSDEDDDGTYDLCGKVSVSGDCTVDIVRNDATGTWSVWMANIPVKTKVKTRTEAVEWANAKVSFQCLANLIRP